MTAQPRRRADISQWSLGVIAQAVAEGREHHHYGTIVACLMAITKAYPDLVGVGIGCEVLAAMVRCRRLPNKTRQLAAYKLLFREDGDFYHLEAFGLEDCRFARNYREQLLRKEKAKREKQGVSPDPRKRWRRSIFLASQQVA